MDEEVWKCETCGKEFKTKDEAEKHEENCVPLYFKIFITVVFVIIFGLFNTWLGDVLGRTRTFMGYRYWDLGTIAGMIITIFYILLKDEEKKF